MAKEYIECPECGGSIVVGGKNRCDAQWLARRLVAEGALCSECSKLKRDKDNQAAAERNAAEGLPELVGSPKQVAWAESIRAEVAEEIRKHCEEFEVGEEMTARVRYFLLADNRASYWIETRNYRLESRLQSAEKDILSSGISVEDHQDLQEEITVRPESPVSRTVAVISYPDDRVLVRFPERVETFRLIMRSQGFSWGASSECWSLVLGPHTGAAVDVAASVMHLLLSSGFIVQCMDNEAREKALAGTYAQRHLRWIVRVKESFGIVWVGSDDSVYSAVNRIPKAAKVVSSGMRPRFIVPGEEYERVLGFAQLHDFHLTDGAEALVVESREGFASMLLARDVPPVPEPPAPEDFEADIAAPDHVDIPDDLRDE